MEREMASEARGSDQRNIKLRLLLFLLSGTLVPRLAQCGAFGRALDRRCAAGRRWDSQARTPALRGALRGLLEEAGFDLLLRMMSRQWAARISALVGFAAVALGAFGAHGLRAVLEQHGSRPIWETAVLYHLAHSVMLFFLAGRSGVFRSGPWLCFVFGIVIFSGSLYLLAVSGWRWWGAVTPVGGVAFLAGWLWLAIRPGIEPEL